MHNNLIIHNIAVPAIPNVDYDPIPDPTVVTFPTFNPCVEFTIVDDQVLETLEYFIVDIAVLASGPASIADNDAIALLQDTDGRSMQCMHMYSSMKLS